MQIFFNTVEFQLILFKINMQNERKWEQKLKPKLMKESVSQLLSTHCCVGFNFDSRIKFLEKKTFVSVLQK
jgi:hypothetical protein